MTAFVQAISQLTRIDGDIEPLKTVLFLRPALVVARDRKVQLTFERRIFLKAL